MECTAAIPTYPDTRPVELSDRELLQQYFSVLQPVVSEFSFANLFLFRHVHRYSLSRAGDSLIIGGRGYDGREYFLPPLSGSRGESARMLLDAGHELFAVDERFAETELAGRGYALTGDRDSYDYLYLRRELADLSGRKFHKKHNRVNYFAAHNEFTVEPYSPRHLEGTLQLLDTWQRLHGDDGSLSRAAETDAAREGLIRADELGMNGVVVVTAKGVAAYALGETLNVQTVVCHFEKSDPFLEGAAQLVNREFCRAQPADIIYVNREQDLGQSGLRAAKSSYHPCDLVKKFRVRLMRQP